MKDKQKELFEKYGARVKALYLDGSITIECSDVVDFVKRAYGLTPITSYTLMNYKYTVFSSICSSDDIIVVKTVFNDLHVLIMPDFEIYY